MGEAKPERPNTQRPRPEGTTAEGTDSSLGTDSPSTDSPVTGAVEDLDVLREQREALARRVRLPWWYVAVYAVAMGAVLGAPFVAHLVSPGWSNWIAVLPALIVVTLLDKQLARATGAQFSRRTLRAYPSARAAGIVTIVLCVPAILGEQILINTGQPLAAAGVLAAATAVVVGCLFWQARGIRRDVREGRAVAG